MNEQRTRAALIALCTVLSIVLVCMVGITVYAEYLLGQMNYVDGDVLLPSLSQEEIDQIQMGGDEDLDPDSTSPTMDGEQIDWGEVDQTIGGDDDIVNIMLIGQDRRPGESRARSDSMILVTFNKVKKTITMTSFMRDLYVKIPGYLDNRINVSYYFGGMELLDRTLEKNFGVIVDAHVEVDFDQFEYLIDLLGGVEIELDAAEARYINGKLGGEYVTEGVNVLNGREALWHARNRSTGGNADFGRTNRQREVLNALIEAYKDQNAMDMLGMLDDILPMVTTDLTKGEVISYVTALFPMLADSRIITQHIPVDGGYSNATIRGMAVLVPNMEVNRQALIDSLTNE